jgi:hypothetical protein
VVVETEYGGASYTGRGRGEVMIVQWPCGGVEWSGGGG